jgi:hypothetical protein
MHEMEDCFGLTKSPEIVASLKQSPIKKIVRAYFDISFDRLKEEHKSRIPVHDLFNIMSGPLLLHLENGDVIGFENAPIKDSIVAWYEVLRGKQHEEDHYMRDLRNYMEHDDPVYSTKDNWAHMIGKKITSLKVLVYDKGKIKRYFDDSFQNAIIFETAKGDMVLSHCLQASPTHEPFPLTRKSEIPQEIWDKATVIEL